MRHAVFPRVDTTSDPKFVIVLQMADIVVGEKFIVFPHTIHLNLEGDVHPAVL